MAISEFCKLDVVCCEASASISEVAELMRTHHVGAVIVTGKNGEASVPLGIVTDRDIVIEAVAPRVDLNMLTAGDIMNSPLETVDENASFLDTLRLMGKFRVRRIPVVRDDGTLSGIVTADDIVNALAIEMVTITSVFTKQPAIESRARR